MLRLFAASALLCCVAVSAQAMTVNEFLGKIDGLKAKGIGALFSSDIGLLKAEMRGIVADYRTDLQSARTEGRTPHSCPPPEAKKQITRDELIAELRRIPAAQRGMSMKKAFYGIMERRYPCA